MPDPLARELLDAARAAFTQGLQVGAFTSVLVTVATTILATVLLRHVRGGSEPGKEPDLESVGAVTG